jgi:DNA-binding response OmpR family regulator
VISSPNIVVVDDESSVRAILRDMFVRESFIVHEAESQRELMDIMSRFPIDLVTLDLTLATENGLDILRDLRAESDVGVILVTGKDELIDKVTGLELGADDHISKPFLLREVLARTRSVLRRRTAVDNRQKSAPALHEPTETDTLLEFTFAPWTLSQASLELRHASGELQSLTTNEYRLLELFVTNPSRVLSRDRIMDKLRGMEWSPTDRSIDNYVARLRRKIERDGGTTMIKTVRGYGYQFTTPVTRQKASISS